MCYLSNAVIESAIDTAVGVPINLEHNDEKQYGVVVGASKDIGSDWYIAEMMITDENMANALNQADKGGYKLSNEYRCSKREGDFIMNGVPYQVEITQMAFEGLAFTKTPRYNEAVILNSKGDQMIVLNGKEYSKDYVAQCIQNAEQGETGLKDKLLNFLGLNVDNGCDKKKKMSEDDKKSEEKKSEKKSEKEDDKKSEEKDKKEDVKNSEEKADEKEAEAEEKIKEEDGKTSEEVKNSLKTVVHSDSFEFVEKTY